MLANDQCWQKTHIHTVQKIALSRAYTCTMPHDVTGKQQVRFSKTTCPNFTKFSVRVTCGHGPALVAEWLTHSAAMCSRAWRAQWPGFDSARARPPTKEFLIIPTHMMNKEIMPGRKKEGSTVSSINCDRCRQLDLAVSCLPAAPAWVEANRLGWPLVGVIHSASQG